MVLTATGVWNGTEFEATAGELELAYTLRIKGLNDATASELSGKLLKLLGDASDFELKNITSVIYTLQLAE